MRSCFRRCGLLGALALLVASGCGDSAPSGNDNELNNNNQTPNLCGNGEIDGLEECDDGAANSDTEPDACRTDCSNPGCGDDVVDNGEACDDGAANSDEVPDACRSDCTDPSCGDGVVDIAGGETCDDGNTTPDDGCSADCVVEYCGNGMLETGEECDDSNTEGGDGCSAICRIEVCGNGFVDLDAGELCDLGAANSDLPNALCREDCTPQSCGDGIIDDASGEVCEGSVPTTDATCGTFGFYQGTLPGQELLCTNCRYDTSVCDEYCGDSVRNGPELCDGSIENNLTCVDLGFDTGALYCSGSCAYDIHSCKVIGWEAQESDSPWWIYAVWGSGQNDVWAVGVPGRVLHNDGSGWTKELDSNNADVSTVGNLFGVWGSGPSDVHAVGQSGIMYYDGNSWSASLTGLSKQLYAVGGSSPTSAYAVGQGELFPGDESEFWEYDGSGWTRLSPGITENLWGVWSSGPTETYAVGRWGRLLHYDGANFQTLSVTTSTLTGISGHAPGEAMAVGSGGEVLLLSGGVWTPMTTGFTEALLAVWYPQPDVAYAVGYNGDVIHYDGVSWHAMDGRTGDALEGIWGSDPDNVWTVGANGTIRYHNGVHWLAHDTNTPFQLNGVWADSYDDIFAVGWSYNTGTEWRSTILRWEPHAATPGWTDMSPPTTVSSWDLRGVWGASPSEVWAVGDVGTILYYDGVSWTKDTAVQAAYPDYNLTDVWGSGASDVFVVGERWPDGLVLHNGGSGWTEMVLQPGTGKLLSVSGSSGSDVWAVGEGTVIHYDGVSWSANLASLNIGGDTANGVFALSANNVWIAGNNGLCWHWNNVSWTACDTGNSDHRSAVWASSPSDVYLVGAGGQRIPRFDGQSWSPLKTLLVSSAADITGIPGYGLIVVGWGGSAAMLKYPGYLP